MTLQPCVDELLKRGADYWIQATEVAWVARSICGAATEAESRKLERVPARAGEGAARGRVFLTTRGTRFGIKRIQDLVRSNARAAGLTVRVTPHTLRHGCATHLLRGGADIRHVQKLLGHASVETTAIYIKVAPIDLAYVLARAHPRERAWARRHRQQR